MTRRQVREMVLAIIGAADYDVVKSFDPELSEDPEYAEERLEKIVDIARSHIKKAAKK